VPLLLLAADRFIVWIKKPNAISLVCLSIVTILCFLTRLEAIILIPVFFIFGWLTHSHGKQALGFLLITVITYNLICFAYYTHFGCWRITNNAGWAFFHRITRATDHQFDIDNGPASRKIYEYMHQWIPKKVPLDQLGQARLLTFLEDGEQPGIPLADIGLSKEITILERQMSTLNFAQRDLGYLEADRLFFRACIEAVLSGPWKFTKFTFLRILGQLDVYHIPGLNHKEFPYETDTGHLFGFGERRIIENKDWFIYWLPKMPLLNSPLQWERNAIKARLCRVIGLKKAAPAIPDSFQIEPNVELQSGLLRRLSCGDGTMQERYWHCRDLDVYFFFAFWGYREYSPLALKILKYWDRLFMPSPWIRINIHRIMWILWFIGIFIVGCRWQSLSSAAFLSIVFLYAFLQSIFSDNFGGRFELHMRPFLWLGAFIGVKGLIGLWLLNKQKVINQYLNIFSWLSRKRR
jgi:hypothetical protein